MGKARELNYEKIKELEDELKKTKYNKRTQHHIALVKAKIAKLKDKEQSRSSGTATISDGYHVRKTGDGTVILVGFPSVGKSTLLNALTDAKSDTAAYAFTTLTAIPGVLDYQYAKIQILDVPGIVDGAASGRGRGREVLSCAMSADLVLIIVDVFNPRHLDRIKKEIRDAHLRINQEKPDVRIVKTIKGGIDVGSTVKLTKITKDNIIGILKEFKIVNAQVVLRTDIDPDEFIDVVENNKKYVPAIVVLNKIDMIGKKKIEKIRKEIKPDLCISASEGTGIDDLKRLIFDRLGFMRVFCKDPGKKPDMDEPLILRRGDTLKSFCDKLHKDFSKKFKFARIWGSSKFPGQDIRKLSYELKDNDIVELHLS